MAAMFNTNYTTMLGLCGNNIMIMPFFFADDLAVKAKTNSTLYHPTVYADVRTFH